MSVPDFQSLMLPVLCTLGIQSPITTQEIRQTLAKEFSLSESDLCEQLPSGRQTTFTNRVAWALSYLKQASLIGSPRRGVYAITDRGRQILTEQPIHIDIQFLSRFPEFQAFRQSTPSVQGTNPATLPTVGDELTPDEQIRLGYKRLRDSLAIQLFERVKALSAANFEQLAIDVVVGLGYGGSFVGNAKVVGRSGDGGIDGIIKEDQLGLDSIFLQAKHWEGTVGRPEIHRFAGALQSARARKGIFITTSGFSAGAIACAADNQTPIALIDGRRLIELMMNANIGVSCSSEIKILKQNEDYFEALETT